MMASVGLLDELGEDLGVTPTLGRLLLSFSWKKIRSAYWTPMTANHYRLVGPDRRSDAAGLIWDEYKAGGLYADASNRDWGSVLRFLLLEYPGTMLRHFPHQMKNLVTTGKFHWNPLV